MTNAADLTAALHDTIRDRTEAEEVVTAKRIVENRLHVALALVGADLPSGALVDVMTWEDEPNEDGTYDVDLSEAHSADGDTVYGDLGGRGALAAGHYDGQGDDAGTDWDLFLAKPFVPEHDAGNLRILSVDKVREWVATQGWLA